MKRALVLALALAACGAPSEVNDGGTAGGGAAGGSAGGAAGGTAGGAAGGTAGGAAGGSAGGAAGGSAGGAAGGSAGGAAGGSAGGAAGGSAGGTAGGSAGGAAGGTGGGSPAMVRLTNNPTTCNMPPNFGPLAPDFGEQGFFAAVRLIPPTYPFTVKRIRHQLGASVSLDCVSGMAHRLDVFKGTAAAPASTPTIEATVSIAATDAVTGAWIERDLPTPVTLTTGESLFIALQLPGTSTEFTCVARCDDSPYADRNYWSNATSAPFGWTQLSTFGPNYNRNSMIEAFGD